MGSESTTRPSIRKEETMVQNQGLQDTYRLDNFGLFRYRLLLAFLIGTMGFFLTVMNANLPHGNDAGRVAKLSDQQENGKEPFIVPIGINGTTDITHKIWERSGCAPGIQQEKRVVLFVELNTWKHYYGSSPYKTGEYYVSATWDYALRRNGFAVHRVSTKQFYDRMKKNEIKKYHLIFVRDPKWHRYYDEHDILCKVRPMYYFGGWYQGRNPDNYRFQFPFAESQILTAHPGTRNNFLGYFPHNLLINEDPPKAKRGRVGLLYGKKPEYFDGREDLIQALLDEGFELHATCKGSKDRNCTFPVGVIQHGHLKPDEFSNLMRSFSFMLGFQRPPASPSPLVGMSWGVAFLNPLRNGTERNATQHNTLTKIGMPYSYVVDLDDTNQVVQAAEWATQYRFASFVPSQFRVESLVDRVCNLVEDESLCICPNPLFGTKTLKFSQRDETFDCHSSSFIAKTD